MFLNWIQIIPDYSSLFVTIQVQLDDWTNSSLILYVLDQSGSFRIASDLYGSFQIILDHSGSFRFVPVWTGPFQIILDNSTSKYIVSKNSRSVWIDQVLEKLFCVFGYSIKIYPPREYNPSPLLSRLMAVGWRCNDLTIVPSAAIFVLTQFWCYITEWVLFHTYFSGFRYFSLCLLLISIWFFFHLFYFHNSK